MNILDEIRSGGESDAQSILNKLHKGIDNMRVFSWPGQSSVKVAVRLLSAAETHEARIAVQHEFKSAALDITLNIDAYRAHEAAHALVLALINPTDKKQLFRNADELRSYVTDDELAALSNEYNALCDEFDPRIHDLSEDDANALLDVLKKTPDLIPGRVQSLGVAWMLLRTLIKQQET